MKRANRPHCWCHSTQKLLENRRTLSCWTKKQHSFYEKFPIRLRSIFAPSITIPFGSNIAPRQPRSLKRTSRQCFQWKVALHQDQRIRVVAAKWKTVRPLDNNATRQSTQNTRNRHRQQTRLKFLSAVQRFVLSPVDSEINCGCIIAMYYLSWHE